MKLEKYNQFSLLNWLTVKHRMNLHSVKWRTTDWHRHPFSHLSRTFSLHPVDWIAEVHHVKGLNVWNGPISKNIFFILNKMDYYTVNHSPYMLCYMHHLKNKLLWLFFSLTNSKKNTFLRGPIRTKQELQLERFRANRSKL